MASGVARHPAFGQPVPFTTVDLTDDPDTQVSRTIAVMRQMAVEDSHSPYIESDAGAALRLSGGDPLRGVFDLVKSRLKFTFDKDTSDKLEGTGLDPESIIEVVIRPVDLSLMFRKGLQPIEDCDGYHAYAASLLVSLGVRCAFCTVAAESADPERYSHVYLVCYVNGERIPFDCSHGDYVGWECTNRFGKRREWPVNYTDGSSVVMGAAVVAGLLWFLKGSKR